MSDDRTPPGDDDLAATTPSLAERLDPLGVVVGAVVGAGGLLFLAYPYVGRVPVGGARIPAFVLAAGVLALGFGVGAVGFWYRGLERLAVGHAGAALAWTALFAGGSVGSQVLVVAGVAVVVAGGLFLADTLRRRRA